MRAIDELLELTLPPAAPQGAPFDWDAAEAAVGSALPADYKVFCDLYGHGAFSNGWGWFPLMPFAQDREDDLVSSYWRDILADSGGEHRPFPEPGGVLPFAYSELKYFFWWLTVGPPDSWPVLVESDDGSWRRFELTATEILARILRNELFRAANDDERTERHVEFTSLAPRRLQPSRPLVIRSWGTTRMGAGQPEEHQIDLDLANALGGHRHARLDELLTALEPSLRATIVRAEAKRSKEVLQVRARADIDPLRVAIQAWADHVSEWS